MPYQKLVIKKESEDTGLLLGLGSRFSGIFAGTIIFFFKMAQFCEKLSKLLAFGRASVPFGIEQLPKISGGLDQNKKSSATPKKKNIRPRKRQKTPKIGKKWQKL